MLLTTVGYNAGPAAAAAVGGPLRRPARRHASIRVDFIECAPFTETRNYMMRVMENMAVYRRA